MKQDPSSTLQDEVQLHPDYVQGLRHFNRGNLILALASFKSAHQSTDIAHVYARLYMSFLGITQIRLNDVSGLNLCRQAAQEEMYRAEVFENLVRAELLFGHRRCACEAMRRGLRVNSGHAGLRALREEMGARRSPCFTFLDRDNPLNRIMGKLTYRLQRGAKTGC